ncbi:MAG: hypothetical protein GX127_07035 [Eubacteriaceae bacterium]|jgi:predicted Fe-Mo cluster-binding NifX family protein|nr:hypothetical protein [Eubacteriaceae bacterium]
MKIALPYDHDQVHSDFGKAQEFVVYHFQFGRIAGKELVEAPGKGYQGNIDALIDANAVTIICHRIEEEALEVLYDEGFEVFTNKQGQTDGLVTTYMAQKLPHGDTPFTLPEPSCGEHCNHHHGEGQQCGHHHGDGHNCEHHSEEH